MALDRLKHVAESGVAEPSRRRILLTFLDQAHVQIAVNLPVSIEVEDVVQLRTFTVCVRLQELVFVLHLVASSAAFNPSAAPVIAGFR